MGAEQLEELLKCLSLASVGVLRIGSHNCVIYSNALFDELLSANEDALARFLAGDEALVECQLSRQNGSHFMARVTMSEIENGERLVLISDLTSQLSHQELAACKEELTKCRQDAERFAYLVSHDLQEPVRAVTNYAGLLNRKLEGKLEEKTLRYLSHVTSGAARVQAMIQGLLRYSRSGNRREPDSTSQLNKVLDEVLVSLSREVDKSQVMVDVQDELPVVQIASAPLKTVFKELFENAFKFKAPDRKLALRISGREDDEGNICVRVSDNGIGIPEGQGERVFEIFRSLHRYGEYPGNGIGLSVCRRILESWNGAIWVEADLKQAIGTTLIVRLPAKKIS